MKQKNTLEVPIRTLHLFKVLDKMLIQLLSSLTEEQWQLSTIARLWKVKDIAAHLLDGNVRTLSISRDGYFGEKPVNIESYKDLVDYLNKLNHSWTDASRRLSPQLLTDLLEITGKQYIKHLKTLDPFDEAVFSVAWAGQEVSPNWFHIAREYTEKFLHQQQIRDAVGQQALFTKKLYRPFLQTFMQALPYTYRNTAALPGTYLSVIITGKAGGEWHMVKATDGWNLTKKLKQPASATVTIDSYDAWQLFSKALTPAEAESRVKITGDIALGKVALGMVSVMA